MSKLSEKLNDDIVELYFNATEEQKNDRDWIFSIFALNQIPITLIKGKWVNDKKLAMMIANSYPEHINLFGEIIMKDKEVMLEAVRFGYSLRHLPKIFSEDKDIIKAYDEYTADLLESRDYEKHLNLGRSMKADGQMYREA